MKKDISQKGFVLAATYMLMTVVSVTSIATYMRAYTYTHEAERQKNALIALEMAESAVDKAITQLAADSSYSGTGGYTDFSTGSSPGGYSIAVTTPAGAASNIRQIAVAGYAPSNTATAIGYKTVNANVYVSLPQSSYFTMAAYAINSMEISGHPTIDSYNSGSGVYDAATANSNGDVGTSSTAAGAVNFSGSSSTIKGDVLIGVSGDTSTVITTGGHPTITGVRAVQTTNPTFLAPTAPSASSGNLTISNGTTTLAAGTYVYTDITISSNGSLATSGQVTIYATGTVNLGGGGVAGSGQIPANLKIYVTSSNDVHVTGNSAMYAAIYAPLCSVELGGTGGIYGGVVGRVLNISGNGNIHYDEALGSSGSSSGGDPTVLTYVQMGNGSWTN